VSEHLVCQSPPSRTHARLRRSKWVKDESDTFLHSLGGKNCLKTVGPTRGSPWRLVYSPKTKQSLPHSWTLPTTKIEVDEDQDDQHLQNEQSLSNLDPRKFRANKSMVVGFKYPIHQNRCCAHSECLWAWFSITLIGIWQLVHPPHVTSIRTLWAFDAQFAHSSLLARSSFSSLCPFKK
jgi:hypothetical protein